jgi:uncharacterized cysteine cluster protein YcgN (CxxCxxCC family)
MADLAPFWQRKTLAQLSHEEWESLCDRCGKCCLEKLEDSVSRKVSYTRVACRLLDINSGCCKRYVQRRRWVPNCEQLSPDNIQRFHWLPSTCAYRLIWEGQPLPDWHPLLTGDPGSTAQAGVSVRGRAIPAGKAGPLYHHVVTWPA